MYFYIFQILIHQSCEIILNLRIDDIGKSIVGHVKKQTKTAKCSMIEECDMQLCPFKIIIIHYYCKIARTNR